MIISTRGSIVRLLIWQWRKVIVFTVAPLVVMLLHTAGLMKEFTLPTTPVIIVGGALGIFVSFRTNSSYDRWWEARKLWGRLVNSSRHFVNQVSSYVLGPEAPRQVRALTHRQIGYVHALRVILRQQDLFADERVASALDADELESLRGETNPTHALLYKQSRELAALADSGALDERRLESLDRTLRELLDIQGGCERIKKTPLPRGYGFIAERLILVFGVLFPLSLAPALGWWVIPINVLVSLSFALISEVGRVLEDPFTMFYNGLPLNALSTMIEANLRQRIGEEPPEISGEAPSGILM